MHNKIDLGIKFRDRISSTYKLTASHAITGSHNVSMIDHRADEIKKYPVIFWHRLLKTIYDEPIEIECEVHSRTHEGMSVYHDLSFRKTKEKDGWELISPEEASIADLDKSKIISIIPMTWKYIVKLPSGGFMELGSLDKNTSFYIFHFIPSDDQRAISSREAEKFIDDLLQEANRVAKDLFNPQKDFDKRIGVKTYSLWNLYLTNYLSANTMHEIATSQETELHVDFSRTNDSMPESEWRETAKLLSQNMMVRGMFYCSCITYYFMALEGFVNLLYHVFLKKRFRDDDFRIDQRLDLEQKIRFMPSLCQGFNERIDLPSGIFSNFKLLKNYRNSLFHSKIEDSLKSLDFREGGFHYSVDLGLYKDQIFPSFKADLTIEHVDDFKRKVDEIVSSILELMDENTRRITDIYILPEPLIPIEIKDTGETVIFEFK